MNAEIEDLTRDEYELFRKLVYARSGINLGGEKMQLVRSRLGKRLRRGGFTSYRTYYDHVVRDQSGAELSGLLDAISTNTTHLYREPRHFEVLSGIIHGWLDDAEWRAAHETLRIWSAGCSSGEEPHTLAMVAGEALRRRAGVNLKILATDISGRMLDTARRGIYPPDRAGSLPAALRQRYLGPVTVDGARMLRVSPEVSRVITFARFNFMSPTFPFRNAFDVIFCRNVMIYFDKPTQQTLVNKFARHLATGGYLMIGHSESLNGIDHPLQYVEPTVYRKS